MTGSSQGIGLGIAEALAAAGCHLIVHGSRSPDRAADVVQSLRDSFPSVTIEYLQANLSQRAEVEGLVTGCIETFGRLDILGTNRLQ